MVFYSPVGVWVVGTLLGQLFALPYVRRMYGGVTLSIRDQELAHPPGMSRHARRSA
jgi:hypothetical protein